MQIFYEDGQASLFDRAGCVGKTSQEPSPPERPREKTSELYWRRSAALKAAPLMSLDLTPDNGNLLGEYDWELVSPWRGDALTRNTGVSPRGERGSSLSQILQDSVPKKYYLTTTACLGILRRAAQRGKALPPTLKLALELQSGLKQPDANTAEYSEIMAFAQNQRDEVRDLRNMAGTLSAQPGIKQQTFVAGFSAGAGSKAGTIGYNESVAPTLKGSPSGNAMPSILCLNDQGGSAMECSEDVSGAMRAQEHGHQPLVYGNHGMDSRYTGPHKVVPTMSARCGTGGGNTPLVQQDTEVICISGNTIGRQPENGGNGLGCQENVSYTLTATDRHALFSRQRVDIFKPDEVACTQSARQHKDATDLVMRAPEQSRNASQLIRRLTPLECERLQGFPDGWTDIPDASDSARYKALGNSVAIPCVAAILQGIAHYAENNDEA